MAEETKPPEKFEEWAIVDVMGHQRYVGRVSEQVIAGQGFVRVDIPKTAKVQEWTKLIGTASIYAITPVSEEIARAMAGNQEAKPVTPYQLTPRITAQASVFDERAGDDDDDDYDEPF